MGPVNKESLNYAITINYNEQDGPAKAFKVMGGIIDAFSQFDHDLVMSSGTDLKTIAVLNDVHLGSLVSWLRSKLMQTDGNCISDLGLSSKLENFLVRSKYYVLEVLDKKNGPVESSDIKEILSKINKESQDSGVSNLPFFTEIPVCRLIDDVANIQKQLTDLNQDDSVMIKTDIGQIYMNPKAQVSEALYEELVVTKRLVDISVRYLRVKKPDYLGDSQWEFKHGSDTILARVMDENWLKRFRNREIILSPGDSMKVRVYCESLYDEMNELVTNKYKILEVIDVLPTVRLVQGSTLNHSSNEPNSDNS